MGTDRAQPDAGDEGMTSDRGYLREFHFLSLPWMLLQPFLGATRDR